MNKHEAQLMEDYGVNVESINGIPVVFPDTFEDSRSYIYTFHDDPERGKYFEFMAM